MAITEISKEPTKPLPTYVFSPTRVVSKLELIETFDLPYRDLRKLDSSFKFQHPAVMVRPDSAVILVNLEDIRCIIAADRAILCESEVGGNGNGGAVVVTPRDERGHGSSVSVTAHHKPDYSRNSSSALHASDMRAEPPPTLELPAGEDAAKLLTSKRYILRKLKAALQTSGKMSTLAPTMFGKESPDDGSSPTSFSGSQPSSRPSQNLPFEFLVLETILQSVLQSYNARFAHLQPLLVHTLRQVQLQHITHSVLENVLKYDKSLTELTAAVDSFRNAVLEVLSNDQDMSEMYLTDFKNSGGVKRKREQHEEVELLFETYLKQSSELLSLIYALQQHKASTEQLAALFLDHQRNTLLKFDVGINVGAISLAAAIVAPSLFGMNLASGLENVPGGLYVVSVVCAVVGGAVYFRLRRRMMNILSFGGK